MKMSACRASQRRAQRVVSLVQTVKRSSLGVCGSLNCFQLGTNFRGHKHVTLSGGKA